MSPGSPGPWTGARALARGLRVLVGHPRLWPWALLPMLLNLVAFGLAAALFFSQLDSMSQALSQLLDVRDPAVWYEWIWLGPLRALVAVLRWLLIVAFVVLGYFVFTLVGGIIAAPFLELLSQRVERIATGALIEQSGGLRQALGSIWEEAKRVVCFVLAQLVFLALSLIPVLGLVAVAFGLALSALFLALDYTTHVLDRRSIPFSAKRRWLWQQRTPLLGFGIAGLGTFLVPGLNFLCLPWLVVSGTLLALEVGPPESIRPADAASGTPRPG